MLWPVIGTPNGLLGEQGSRKSGLFVSLHEDNKDGVLSSVFSLLFSVSWKWPFPSYLMCK